MKKRVLICLLAVSLLLTGCAQTGEEQFTLTYLDLFDTVTTVIGKASNESEFNVCAQAIREELEYYHKLFDIYHSYDGLNNLKTVNDQAGIAPVEVDGAIVDLLQDCKTYHELTKGKVNVAMGSVLQLWHRARTESLETPEDAYIPKASALEAAAEHTDIGSILIDEAASTVYISDPQVQLDVGAIAKGWAAQRVAENAPTGYLISVGGNVCVTGPKAEDGTPWVIGIQDPDQADANLHTVSLAGGCLVTSGDYQRTFEVAGEQYHHIIDPQTLMPGTLWRSVTVMCGDSAVADALSTALFLLPLEEGIALSESCGANALWVNSAGEEFYTSGFEKLLQK